MMPLKGLDFGKLPRMCVCMAEPDHSERTNLISRLFTLITMKCEDGATLAVDGQSRSRSASEFNVLAEQLASAGEEISTIADAIVALCAVSNPDSN
jgi:hypothetical protein